MKTRTNLLGSDGVLPNITNKGDGRNRGEKIAWNNVVNKAAYENQEEELQPSTTFLWPFFFVMQRPAQITYKISTNKRKPKKMC